MKKNILIILIKTLVILTAFNACAQDKQSTLDLLQANTWKIEDLTDKKATVRYDNTNRVTHYFNGVELGVLEYYLSDTIDQVFSSKKIGKLFDGKYIITRMIRKKEDKRQTPTSAYEIIQINKNILILRKAEHKHLIKYKAEK